MRRSAAVLAFCLLALSTTSAGAEVAGVPPPAPGGVPGQAPGGVPGPAPGDVAGQAPGGVTAASAGFGDVADTSAHAEAIGALARAGITSGCADGRYCPRSPVTRDQMASFLVRALGLDPPVAGTAAFSDVAPGSTHAGAIAALAQAGITAGCADGRYCPRTPVTRDQMASFLVRGFDLPPDGDRRFADVSASSPHAAAVGALAGAGVTTGCAEDRYCPRHRVTRDQMASFLARALGLVGPPGPPVALPSTGAAPSGAVLAFVREPFSGCTGPCAEHTAIWTARADGADARAVTQPAGAFDRYPRWAPDGSTLAFVRTPRGATAGEVYAVDLRDGRPASERRVTSTAGAHGGRGCHGPAMVPVWSPDSRRIALACAAGAGPGSASTVSVVGADGSGRLSLPAGRATADAWPTWSPDSRRLAFARTNLDLAFGAPQRKTIGTVDVGGSAPTNLRTLVAGAQAADHPRWSPAGDRVLYVSVDEVTLQPSLRTVRAAGGASTTVYTAPSTQAVQLYDAVWSPAGGHVAFPVGDGLTRSVVHVAAATGGTARAVSPSDAMAFAPSWSPSGHLAFDVVAPSGAGAEAHRLVTAGADGTGRRPVVLAGAYAYDAHWRPGG